MDEASFLWYDTVKGFLENKGCRQPLADPAFFFYQKEGVLQGIATLWVDDIFSTGSDIFEEDIMKPLTERFKFGTFNKGDFKVLGMNIIHRGFDIYLSQVDYIKNKLKYLNALKPDDATPNSEVTEEIKKLIYQIIGMIRWICDLTHPELSYDNLEASIKQKKATWKDIKKINKMVSQALSENYWIRYTKIKGNRWFLTVFVDASLGGLPGKCDSAYGYVIFLSEGFNPTERRTANVIDWQCGKIDRVTTSTYEAESIALREATERVMNIKDMIREITNIPKKLIDIQIFCDNHHVVSSIFSTKDTCKSQMVLKDIGRMKQIIDRSEITSLAWIPTSQNIADVFTKGTAAKSPIINTLTEARFFV